MHLLVVALTRYLLELPPIVAIDDATMVEVTPMFVDRILTGPLPAATRA